MLGIRIEDPRNLLETEILKHGLSNSQVQTKTGNPEFDQEVAKFMGPLTEQIILPFLDSAAYEELEDTPGFQAKMLMDYLNAAQQAATEQAAASFFEQGKGDQVVLLNFLKKSQLERKFLQGIGADPQSTGVLDELRKEGQSDGGLGILQ